METPSRKGLETHEYCGQDYEEDDILSFANPDYDGQFDQHGDHLDNENEHEYQQLLDTHYKELSLFSPSPTFYAKEKDGVDGFDSPEDNDDEEQSERIFKALDEFYVKSNNLQRRRSRHAYPDINIDDMGFKSGLEPDLSLGSPSFSSNRDESLPLGWEKHEDEAGPYYWHIKSGTIQREAPAILDSDSEVTRVSRTERSISENEGSFSAVSLAGAEEAKKFVVRSLGWKEIEKESLTPEKSSRAVNRCILDLSVGKNDTLDGVGRWGDGKDLCLEMYPEKICLVDDVDGDSTRSQPILSVPIETIRVWGVGRDDSRDFAFVTHDPVSDTYKCHVLRCDLPARRIAQALKELCQDYIAKHAHRSGRSKSGAASKRPHTLPLSLQRQSTLLSSGNVFPTPTEEPKKIFNVMYVGRRPVKIGVGIEVLHQVIDQLLAECPEDDWLPISVAVSPSTITLMTQEDEPETVAECRVRYLTFLGIGQNDVRTCGFVVHTPEDTFLAHCFACDPSGGPLCKAIEAACKLRYQKFLDAHSKAVEEANYRETMTPTEKIGAKLRSFFGSVTNHLRTS